MHYLQTLSEPKPNDSSRLVIEAVKETTRARIRPGLLTKRTLGPDQSPGMEVSENAGMSLLSTDWVPRVSGMSIGSLGDRFLGVADSTAGLDHCGTVEQQNLQTSVKHA